MPNLPSYRESVESVASTQNLISVASATNDPEIHLGLSFFAKTGDPARKAIAEMAVRTRSGDPDNSLGYYLRGALQHVSNRESKALEMFRKAAACSELHLCDSITGEALFKALDALDLSGLDRLCALSWTISRWANFSSVGMQPIHRVISELARTADAATRSELAESLITLAGHLFATNFTNRWFAQQAVQSAFALKAELAGAEHAPKMNGYAAAIQGLNNAMLPWTDIEDPMKPNPLQLAQYLPTRIHGAFAAADPSLMNAGIPGGTNLHPPESDQADLEAIKASATQAAKQLIEVALSDADGILGAYFKEMHPPTQWGRNPPWASFSTDVGSLIQTRPDLFKAAAANEVAMNAVWKAGQNDPAQKNMRRLMEIGWAVQSYAHNHDEFFPNSISILFERDS